MRSTTLMRKLFMALTGLFLSFFLVIHLLGNLQLFLPAATAQEQFNYYSALLSENGFIKLVSYALYFSLLGHAVMAIQITIKNRKAAGKYQLDKRARASSWASRNMGFLGFVLFFFLVVHFADFWYVYKFGAIAKDKLGQKDLYSVVIAAFSNIGYVLIYSFAMIALAFHLRHGVYSAVRSMGVFHPKYVRLIKILGLFFTYAISLGFIAIPIFIYLKQCQF